MVFPSVSKSWIYCFNSPIPVVPVTEVILVLQIIITYNNGALKQCLRSLKIFLWESCLSFSPRGTKLNHLVWKLERNAARLITAHRSTYYLS
jgi:hypothetical protein